MQRSAAVLVLLSLTLLLVPFVAASGASDDEAAIRDVVRRVEVGWNANSGEALAAPFAEDADFVIATGSHEKGRRAIAEGRQRIFDTFYKGSRNSGAVQSIRFLRPDVALAHVRWDLHYTRNGAPAEAASVSTIVLTKDAGGWTIAAFQITSIQEWAPPPASAATPTPR